ncbi:MAG: DNA polymerase III subunit delta, partial [Pseudomonadota bacterium]
SVDQLPPVVVVFGPDRGRVSEVAAAIEALFEGSSDPFGIVKLDAASALSEPGRLVDEARTVSMFGGKRLIVVRDGAGKNLGPAVAPLLAEPSADAVVVIEAGDLKKGVGLRKDAEGSANAAAVFCPADTVRDLERMIDEEAATLGLKVDADARAALVERLGADRAASRGEVLKASLHAYGADMLTLADVDAVVGDAAVSDMAEAVEAAFSGDRERLDRLLSRLLRQESQAAQLLMQAQWMLQSLERASGAVAAGTDPSRAVEGVRPPLYGARKATAIRALDRWSPAMLRTASAMVADAVFRTRTMPALAPALARDAFWRIACHRTP